MDTTNNVPQTAPGLLAWIEHACDWEQHRRNDFDFPLQPPEAAIPPEEDAVSIGTARRRARNSPTISPACTLSSMRSWRCSQVRDASSRRSCGSKVQRRYWHTVPGARNTWRVIDLVCVTLFCPGRLTVYA